MARGQSTTGRTKKPMTPVSRTQQFVRLYELLGRHYQAKPADPNQPVLEHLMFAAVLENARHAVAERVFQVLKTEFFDWNEVRVSTIRDLSEAGETLPDPAAAAARVKYPLQHIFESTYSFDLEELRKLPIGQAVERLQKIDGVSRFMISYVVQNALGGHTIPLDAASLRALNLLGLADEGEIASGNVSGLERAIPKSKGIEFAWLLHEFAAEFWTDHHAPTVEKIFKTFDPESLERLAAWEQAGAPAVTPVPEPAGVAASAGAPSAGAQETAAGEAPVKRRGRPPKAAREAPTPEATTTVADGEAKPPAETAAVTAAPGPETPTVVEEVPEPAAMAPAETKAEPTPVPAPAPKRKAKAVQRQTKRAQAKTRKTATRATSQEKTAKTGKTKEKAKKQRRTRRG